MQNVYDLAHELVRSLKETDQYKHYMEVKKKVQENDSVTEMLNSFQEESMAIQTASMLGEEPPKELVEKAQKMYQIVMMDPLAADYVNSEMALSVIVSDIYKIIGDAMADEQK